MVYGAPPEPEGTIDMPIGRCPKPSLLRRIDPLCQPARTRYRLLEQGPAWSLLELEPLTGRTHQLRVHCAFLGCPMLGDPQYRNHGQSSPLHPPGPFLSAALRPGASLPPPHDRSGVSIQSGLGVKLADVPPNLNAAYEKAVCSLL
ncbi:MAG: pseudouridine synthase [Oscillospiraceae bacterium]